jgi:hypothetical protein
MFFNENGFAAAQILRQGVGALSPTFTLPEDWALACLPQAGPRTKILGNLLNPSPHLSNPVLAGAQIFRTCLLNRVMLSLAKEKRNSERYVCPHAR